MRFLGPVTTVDGRLVRPHDIGVSTAPAEGSVPVIVTRVVPLGFEVRLEARAADGSELWAQLSRDRAAELDLRPGETVHFGPASGVRTPVLS